MFFRVNCIAILFFTLHVYTPALAFCSGLNRAVSSSRERKTNADDITLALDDIADEQLPHEAHHCNKLRISVGKSLFSVITVSATMFGMAATASPQSCFASTPFTSASVMTSTNNVQTSVLLAKEVEEEDYSKILNLKAPTDTQPQIKIPSAYKNPSKTNERRPLLQGLVYFAEQQTIGSSFPQDYNDDLLVLTAIPLDSLNREILAGAKIPITSVRFPFVFKMYKENMLVSPSRDVWFGTNDGGEQEDVIVEARICPRDATKFPCDDAGQRRYARGIAKVISGLPGLEEGEVVRAPASLPLQ